jgi:hypothetical protein
MFGTRDSAQKIGRILQRVRSGGGAKSCRSDKGERVIDVKTRSDADSIIGNTDQGLSTPFSLARLRIFLQGSWEGDKVSPEALAKAGHPVLTRREVISLKQDSNVKDNQLRDEKSDASLGF